MKTTLISWAPLVFFLLAAGCAGGQGSRPQAAAPQLVPAGVPAWVKNTPLDPKGQWLYASGYSPRSFYLKDAIEHAKNAARVELAKSLQVSVQETLTDTLKGGQRTAGARAEIVSVSQSTLDAELKDSEIVETWHDKDGLAGEVGAVYALARLKHSK